MSSPLSSSRNKWCVASALLAFLTGAAAPSWAADPRVNGNGGPAGNGGQGLIVDGDEAAADARRRRINDDDWFRDRAFREDYARRGGSEGSVNGEFPSAEVGNFVVANARAATARMMFRRAESALGAAVRGAKRDFEASTELREALAAEREAHAAYDRARREALAEVVASPKYQAILSLHQDLGKQVAARRQELQSFGQRDGRPVIASPTDPDALALFSTAALRMQVAADAREMEREAVEASDDLRAARARLMTAAAKVSDLRREFDSGLREDPDLLAARRVLEDARVSRVTAAAYLRGSRLAAEEAVDFAYFLHRYDAQVAFDPYDGYGYGSRHRYGPRY